MRVEEPAGKGLTIVQLINILELHYSNYYHEFTYESINSLDHDQQVTEAR